MANTTGIGWGRDVWGSGNWGRDFISDTVIEALTVSDASTATYSNLSNTIVETLTLADFYVDTFSPQHYASITGASNTWTTLSSSTSNWSSISSTTNSWTRV